MSNELEFKKKPRRMTSPPQNKSRWLPGYEGVEIVLETNPERMAYFAREATWGDIMREPSREELLDTLREVQKGRVLGAAFKDGIGFRIRASRSCMDQALRLAEGSGGAGSGAGAQTTRDNDQRNFNIIIPNTIENMGANGGKKHTHMEILQALIDDETEGLSDYDAYVATVLLVDIQRTVYGMLVDKGIPPQDARYPALPLGFQTQWFWIMSRGNLIKLCEHRLCNGLTQHETDYLVRKMRDIVVQEWPWMVDVLRSGCEKRGQCTMGTMLFPPCGAFVSNILSKRLLGEPEMHEDHARMVITKYDPEKHLYPASQNDAMQFAQWDVERQELEKERPEIIFSMAGPPEEIGYRMTEEEDG